MNIKTPLFNALKDYAHRSRGYFRIPGHRFERGIHQDFIDFAGKGIFQLDVTETPLTDDLHHPKDVIARSQEIAARAFGAEESFFLVNGTTCGNEAMIIASAAEGEEIIIPRNAHKSVMAGLILGGARPVYAPVEYLEEPGIQAGLSVTRVEDLLNSHPACKAVFAVSPTYHGLCSDIGGLSAVAHNRGIPLLVDEAHGAHCYFNQNLPAGALALGADACAQSLHKVAGALTQSSLLHLNSTLIKRGRIDSALRLLMSTSPSYILMTSLEMAVTDQIEQGESLWNKTIDFAKHLREKINQIPGMSAPGDKFTGFGAVAQWDSTRLIVNLDGLELSGYELKHILYNEFAIDAEMADSRNLLFLLTFGNTEEEGEYLLKALGIVSDRTPAAKTLPFTGSELPPLPPMELTPRQAYFSETKTLSWEKALGHVSAEMIAPYPPGIPVLYPGEMITKEIYEFVVKLKAEARHFHGSEDKSLDSFKVCK